MCGAQRVRAAQKACDESSLCIRPRRSAGMVWEAARQNVEQVKTQCKTPGHARSTNSQGHGRARVHAHTCAHTHTYTHVFILGSKKGADAPEAKSSMNGAPTEHNKKGGISKGHQASKAGHKQKWSVRTRLISKRSPQGQLYWYTCSSSFHVMSSISTSS
eukprot:1127294-Pelagomonas_calceolata.AAC.1